MRTCICITRLPNNMNEPSDSANKKFASTDKDEIDITLDGRGSYLIFGDLTHT